MTVLWPSAVGPPSTYSDAGMDVHRVRSLSWPRSNGFRVSDPRSGGRTVAAVLDAVRPDVVHIQSHTILGRQLARAAVQRCYPLIATNHFMPENVLDQIPFLDRSNRAVSRWAWRDPDRFWQPDHTTPSAPIPTVLFVGRLETEKRIDELLHAFAGLPSSAPARLHIVGTGTQHDHLSSLAHTLGIGHRVTFAGRVEDAGLVAAYRSADIFAMPGTAELQSLATLEAMSAGKPLIAANAMALPHLVTDGHNGYLYTPGHTEQLTDHLSTLLAQPALRRRLGAASRSITKRHSIGHTLDAFEAHYARLSRTTPTLHRGLRSPIDRPADVATGSPAHSNHLLAAQS